MPRRTRNWVTREVAAEMLSVTLRTIDRWCADGDLVCEHVQFGAPRNGRRGPGNRVWIQPASIARIIRIRDGADLPGDLPEEDAL